ncbi:hypothetical protein [Micromonospora sp. CPCC 206061]|uniref:hypothetical protein n=1 Tax=Micromonospora sp. CPCC 206061 TaxID=3122410 RepID=UPI002FF060BA
MAHPSASAVRDAVWWELIRRARQGRPEWVIAADVMAMPGTGRHGRHPYSGIRGEAADLDAEILTGFLHALRGGVDPARLCFAPWRAGREPRLTRQEYPLVDDFERAADDSAKYLDLLAKTWTGKAAVASRTASSVAA